jgi:hypothetical protein
MASYHDREHFIPLRIADLVEFLAAGKGAKTEAPALSLDDQRGIRRLAELLGDHFHHTFRDRFLRIKDAYSPFDPDRDTVNVVSLSSEEKAQAIKSLFDEIKGLLERANYKELTIEQANEVMKGSSLWGIDLDVDWTVFDHIIMYYRGDAPGPRTVRRWWKLWKREEIQVPEFNRLVLVLKQNPHKRLGKDADTSSVFMKIFKDMPKADIEMVLPGTRIRLTKLDRGLIFYPLVSGFALLLYKVLSDFLEFKDIFSIATSISLSWSLAVLFAGYGYKSYSSYASKKTAYTLRLTQSLYYQVIDNNAGVFFRLLDEAEDQEVRESLLAYFYLWRNIGERGLPLDELDDRIEQDLDQRLGVRMDFEIGDALDKLHALGLIQKEGELLRAMRLGEAVAKLEECR